MANEQYLDLGGLSRFLDKIREKELKNRARNYVINPSETLSSEYLNSSFNNADDMSIALHKSSNGTDFKLKDVNGNDILIKDLKMGDLVSIKQISEYYSERFVGLIDNNFVHFYAYTCLAFNHIVQGSMKPVTSGAVYNALLPLTEASVNITDTTSYKISGATDNLALPSQSQMEVLEVRGNSVVRNNQINANNFSDRTIAGLTFSHSGTSVSVSGTCDTSDNYTFYTDSLEANHQYLFVSNSKYSIRITINGNAYNPTNNQLIATYLSDTVYIGINCENGATYTDTFVTKVIDLTQFFGGNVPNGLTAEQFLQEYGSMIPTSQDLGTIVDSKNNLVNTGANIWDEEYLNGYYNENNNGVFASYNNYIASKNAIRVIPSASYVINKNGYVCFYDINKNYLGYSGFASGTAFSVLSNCYYIQFYYNNGSNTYNNDCMLSYGNQAQAYQPHTAHTLTINETLRSAGEAHNTLNLVSKKKKVVVGSVDLGTLNYVILSNDYPNYFLSTNAVDNLKGSTTNVLCAIYSVNNGSYDSMTNMQIRIESNGQITIKNTTYTDATAFKTAMSGVILNFELATPTEDDIDIVNYLPVYMNGTEQQTGDVPYTLVRNYDISVKDQVITNVKVDAKQEEEIQSILKGQIFKTINGYSIIGSGNISISADISHRYNIGLYGSNYTPIFIAFLTDAEQESYDPAPSKSEAIMWIKTHWWKDPSNEIWYATDVTNDAGYYASGTITQAYEGLIGVVYDESQGSGSETITAYFADGTTQQIALSNIGDTDQDNYFFRVF